MRKLHGVFWIFAAAVAVAFLFLRTRYEPEKNTVDGDLKPIAAQEQSGGSLTRTAAIPNAEPKPMTRALPPSQIVSLNNAGEVTDDLAKYLKLSDIERAELNRIFRKIGVEIARLDKLNSDVRFAPSERKMEIEIRPYVDEGRKIKTQLYAEIEQILGAERYNRFREVPAAWLEERYGDFGTQLRIVSIKRELLPDGRFGYRVESTRAAEYAGNTGASKEAIGHIAGVASSRQDLQKFGHHVLQFVPSDF